MTPFSFDTLGASKQLREAGMPEGMAEAVVSVFQHAAASPDISHLATKEDLEGLRVANKADLDGLRVANKADLEGLRVANKADLEGLRIANKADLEGLRIAAKADVEVVEARLRTEIMASEARVRETIRLQGWALMGGMGIMLAVFGSVAGFLA